MAGNNVLCIERQDVSSQDLSGITVACWRLVFFRDVFGKLSFSRFNFSSAASRAKFKRAVSDELAEISVSGARIPQTYANAKTHRLSAARAFASVWFRRCRKKRKAS